MIALQKSLILAFVVAAVTFWCWQIYLDGVYSEHGVTMAVPAEGKIYARKVYLGRQVFLTEREKFNLDVLLPSMSIGSFLIAVLLDSRWKHFVFKKGFHGADPFYVFRRKRKN